ncbi:MAG TPA: DUF6065 family protein [Tepidisphaeraceae bacterium]|nr:DUF6065 family protein [Tepidisphaeraceae bacterium]
MPDIEFHADDSCRRDCPAPYPAAQAAPDWLKSMAPQAGEHGTVKRCPPFVQALTAGYIIPAPTDFHFQTDAAGEINCTTERHWIEGHFPEQYAGSPFAGARVVKFLNPWVVRTPPGYSALFCMPFNRFHIPFALFGGIVETDTFYRQVHFPAISMLARGTRYTLPKNTPLMQVIPFLRETWESKVLPADVNRIEQTRSDRKDNPHLYKEVHWQKQEFK